MEELSRVVEAYRDAELYLLRLIAGAVEGSGTQHHYMNQHRELTRIIQLVEARLNQLAGHLDKAVLEELERVYAAAVREAITQTPTPVPSLIPTTAVEATAVETAGVIASQHQTILRTVQDRYREAAQTSLTRALVSGESNLQTVQAMLNRMADKGLTGFIDRAGRSWDMGTYADMAIRTGRMRALNQGHMDGWQHAGVELVRVSQHPASHPWCYPYQGELLAISGPAGPRTLTDRVTGKQITVTAVATFQEALAAGYHHPNCRHSEGAYIPGFTSHQPEKVDEAENERQYEALQRQRQIERHIRQWKKREAVALTPQEKAYARRKVRAWQSAQREHVDRHKFLSRRYEREKLRTGKGGAATGSSAFTMPKPKPPKPTLATMQRGEVPTDYMEVARRTNPNHLKRVPSIEAPKNLRGHIPTNTEAMPYSINCTRAQAAFEANMRGYNLTAGPWPYVAADGSVGHYQTLLDDAFKPIDGTGPSWAQVRTPKSGKRGRRLDNQLVKYMEQNTPDGARGYGSAIMNGGYGHAFNWVKQDGTIRFINPQSPDIPFMDMTDVKPGTLMLARVDNYELSDGILKVIGIGET